MKIAVIGGGVAGLYASLVAAEKGAQVTLWEKGKIGEGIVCGECIFDTLDCLPAPAFGMLHPVETLVLWEGEEEFRVPIGRYRKLWMMDRPSWQRGLAAHAAGRGVAIRERSAVSPHDLAHIAATHDWVLDASGAPSLTAKAYRFTAAYYQHFLIACQAKVAGDFSSLFPAIAAGFLPDLPASVMSSYFWIFPQRENQANVGFGLSGPFRKPLINPKRILRELMVARGLVPPEPPTLINGGLIPVQILPTLRYRNILLVGDAAGLASPLHGAGIDTAALSGILAVTVIMMIRRRRQATGRGSSKR